MQLRFVFLILLFVPFISQANISPKDRAIHIYPKSSLKNKSLRYNEAKLASPSAGTDYFDVPVTYNKQVQFWIRYFQTTGKSSFQKWLDRSYKYLPNIHKMLEEEGMPKDLAYIAMIESGFSTQAVSSADAVGPWQFIESTGKRFGLKIDHWIDERRDFDKSTRAAISYMKILNSEFNSWYLVAAAYNTGEGRVRRYIKKFATKDFWQLSRQEAFVNETKNYIPKFLAAVLISKAPQLYGFKSPAKIGNLDTELYAVVGGTHLQSIADRLKVTLKFLKEINPELTYASIPSNIGSHKIRVPKGAKHFLQNALASNP